MIKQLDRYLLRQFFQSLLVVTLAIGLTIIVINMVEELRDFVDHHVPLWDVVQYYLYFGGWVIRSFLPVFILLALLFSVSILARRNEILAMKANGISLYRLTLPFLIACSLLAVGHFYYNEYIFPPINKRRLEIKEFTIERKSREQFNRVKDIYRQIHPGYYYTLGLFDVDRKMGNDFKLYKTEGTKLASVLAAERLEYVDFKWQAQRGTQRVFENGRQQQFVAFDTMTITDIEEKPEDFSKRMGDPEDMGLEDLKNYINLMKRTGAPYLREAVDLKIKYSYPVASIVVVLICLPLASNPRRGGVAVSFAAGAGIALTYFILFRIMQSAGYNEKLPADWAAWGVNILFLVVGSVLMLRARK